MSRDEKFADCAPTVRQRLGALGGEPRVAIKCAGPFRDGRGWVRELPGFSSLMFYRKPLTFLMSTI